MTELDVIRVLLVEDDEEDCFLFRDLLREIKGRKYQLDWARTYEAGLTNLNQNKHDVCLVDYRLGAHTGLELLQTASAQGCPVPIIMLTGTGHQEVDEAAMKAGAADYLVKCQFDSDRLERSIRYAVERVRNAARAAFEKARLAAFGSEIGLELTRRAPLPEILDGCTRAIARYMNVALAQIWVHDSNQQALVPMAHAGPVVDACGKQNLQHPVWNLEELSHGNSLFIKSLAEDQRLSNRQWACQQNLVSFAAQPMLLEDRLVGLIVLYSAEPQSESVLQELASVSNGIAMCIRRKQSEEALDASEGRYLSMVSSIQEVVFHLNEFGQWTSLNPAWTNLTGFGVKETLGTFYLDYFHHDDREHGRYGFLQLINRKIEYCRFETRLLTKDGKVLWVELFMQLLQHENGTVLGASGNLNDITKRKLAEEQAQKLAAFPRVNPNPVLEFDADGRLTYANDAATALANSFKKERIHDILPQNVEGIVRDCLQRGTNRLREEVCLDNRTITWSFFPVPTGGAVHCYGADITEVLNLEAQFRHAQKLESVGQMAAGIAHDFNNILTVIQGYADCLLMRCGEDKSIGEPLKRIAEASRRAAALTKQLLMFSRKQAIALRVLDLNTVLRNLANMITRLLGDDIAVETNYAPDLPQIEGDTGLIEQIVMNLAVNARDAMSTGGRLTINTSFVELDDAQAKQHVDARTGKFVMLSVTDTGSGIEPSILGRIFDPFFSTKEVGHGTGLGLSTVYGIVKQHQGWIQVSSELGVGTTFTIYFPIAATKAAESRNADYEPPVRGGNETILHVEDEPVLRQLVREVLSQYNYTILEAGSGVEALRVWDEHDGKIDLLLTDMVMPEGMTGRELAMQLRRRRPSLRVIYTSGYSLKTFGKDHGGPDTLWLEKPYQPSQLARSIRECLDNTPARTKEPVPA